MTTQIKTQIADFFGATLCAVAAAAVCAALLAVFHAALY